MVVYTVRNATTTNQIAKYNTRAGGIDTYSITRFYMRFNTSSITATLAEISSVSLRVRVTAVANGTDYHLRSADSGDSNWGVALTGDAADFNSTCANLEDSQSITATGYITFTVNKNNLDLTGTTWFSIRVENENEIPCDSTSITVASQNNGTQAYRPQLIVKTYLGQVYILTS